jgi:hypothetical protein
MNENDEVEKTEVHFSEAWAVQQVAHYIQERTGLAFLPHIIEPLPARYRAAAIVALLQAATAGVIELRPDGGTSKFSKTELECSPEACDGSPLLWARIIGSDKRITGES